MASTELKFYLLLVCIFALVAVIEDELNRMNAEWTQVGNVRENGRAFQRTMFK